MAKKLSKKAHGDLWATVDNEGFGYYMLDYGPDLKAIEKLGFNRQELQKAIEMFKNIRSKINEGEEFYE